MVHMQLFPSYQPAPSAPSQQIASSLFCTTTQSELLLNFVCQVEHCGDAAG